MKKHEIENLSYTDFIALIKETNRCPGGKDTIRRIAQNTFLNSNSLILEVGSNTGFTSLEFARLLKCKVSGIDISASCVNEANSVLANDIKEVKDSVTFQVGSAYSIPFQDNQFDLVMVGGATSFMDKKQKAIEEYIRVTKTWGFLSAVQLFYKKEPPKSVLDNVSKALGVEIKPLNNEDWLNIFRENNELELYHFETFELEKKSDEIIDNYVNYFMNKPHIKNYDKETQLVILNKWKRYIDIFNENHEYLGYFISIFRKRLSPEEPELFTKKSIVLKS